MSAVKKRLFYSLAGVPFTALISFLIQRVLAEWGILDPVAKIVGSWLSANAPVQPLQWTFALLMATILYGILLWRVWDVRNVHHKDLSIQTKPQSSFGLKVYSATAASPPERDVWLLDAIWRAHLGVWEKPNEVAREAYDEGFWNRLGVLIHEDIRQLAFDGKLPIWGKLNSTSLWTKIPNEFWDNHGVDWFEFRKGVPENLVTHVYGLGSLPPAHQVGGTYVALMTSKSAVDTIWPNGQTSGSA